jgi:hypothetical protein
MNTKLTLTIDDAVIEKAKGYAYAKGHSLSELVENYLKSLITASAKPNEITPNVKALMGSFKAPADFDYKKVLQEERVKKHG